MPFCRKSPRRPGRHLITLSQLDRANRQVTCEMERLGLWHTSLDDVTVWLVPASFTCYGWFKDDGDIHIPGVTGAQLADLLLGYHTRLTDVLRHEWAHAFADRRSRFVETKRFERTFGGPYESTEEVEAFDPSRHLTTYAATNPSEDFAETFHYYLRHKGVLPRRLHAKPVIARKWAFIASTARMG